MHKSFFNYAQGGFLDNKVPLNLVNVGKEGECTV